MAARVSLVAWLVLLCGSPLVFFTCHVLLQRARPGATPQGVALKACALGVLVVVGASLVWQPQLTAGLYAALVAGAIGYAYFHLFNMSETARRIRILREIHQAGTLPVAAVHGLYEGDELIQRRLERMVTLGQIDLREQRYVLKGQTLYRAAQVVAAWRWLLGFQDGPSR